jgi:hypothetical protein
VLPLGVGAQAVEVRVVLEAVLGDVATNIAAWR